MPTALWPFLTGACLLSAAPYAEIPKTFRLESVEAPRPALDTISDIIAVLRRSQDTRELLTALQRLESWTRPMTQEEEAELVWAVRAWADSPTADPMVRSKAVGALGHVGPWLRSPQAFGQAADLLIEFAAVDHPQDSRFDLRTAALLALARLSSRFDEFDGRLNRAATAALRTLGTPGQAVEDMAARRLLHSLLERHGSSFILRSWDLAGLAEWALITPLERDLESLYRAPRNNTDQRYLLIRSLYFLAWPRVGDGGRQLPHRARQILSRMSHLDPDPTLRTLACRYSGRTGCPSLWP